eukprot:12201334-Heterocapsa_arctica.AAC.1
MEEGVAEEDTDWDCASTSFTNEEKSSGISEEEATYIADNIILPTLLVEPITNMEMKVHMEELENKGEFALCYPSKRMICFSGKT